MAVIPTSGTNIRMISGVPFQADYKNSRWFDTLSEQTTYFLAKPVVHSVTQANFQRIEGRHIVKVNESLNGLLNINYLMFQNAEYNSKWFYAFVTKLEYINKEVTHVHFQLDVLQTWRFEMNFKPSFVEREHCQLWNADGSPVINTIEEGLDYGAEYEVVNVQKVKPYGDLLFMVIVSKVPFHELGLQAEPSFIGAPQPLSYYILPFNSSGTNVTVKLDGNVQAILSKPQDMLYSLYASESAVNNVVSIYITEFFGDNLPYNSVNNLITFSGSRYSLSGVYGIQDSNTLCMRVDSSFGLRDFDYHRVLIDKYEHFTQPSESKLMMFPYVLTELTDLKGSQMTIKNEYVNGDDLDVEIMGSLAPSNRTAYNVVNYRNQFSQIDNLNQMRLTGYQHAVINAKPNDVPIITDMLSAYLQGNRNSLMTQLDTIQFNGVMNAFSGALGMDNAVNGNSVPGLLAGVGATVSAIGNTQLAIEGQSSKIKDINNLPPNISKMGGSAQFDFGYNLSGLYIIKKQITEEYRLKLENYFKMFGYKRQRVKVPNFHTRQHFNYVKTVGCMILGDFNNEDLQELKNIFDNGITLWHTDDVGNYSLANGVI